MEAHLLEMDSLSTSSPSSESQPHGFGNEEKCRFCFICAVEIQNVLESNKASGEDEEDSSKSSSDVPLEVFLQGVDVVCETLRIDRKPFSRDEEWKKFAELDNFVRYICCQQCSKLLINLVSLHELLLSTKVINNMPVIHMMILIVF